MSKLKSKSDVIEWYWPDFLASCLRSLEHIEPKLGYRTPVNPTVDNFWRWYIEDGPMGVKHRNLFYTKEDIEYV